MARLPVVRKDFEFGILVSQFLLSTPESLIASIHCDGIRFGAATHGNTPPLPAFGN
jgi:hypothetical protein